jgi:hypothetical protein
MAGKEISVKKYIVRLSAEERQQLEALIRKGKGPARRAAEGTHPLELGGRTRVERQQDHGGLGRQRVHALPRAQAIGGRGLRGGLSRKQRKTPAVPRIFDGEKEAKLIACGCWRTRS